MKPSWLWIQTFLNGHQTSDKLHRTDQNQTISVYKKWDCQLILGKYRGKSQLNGSDSVHLVIKEEHDGNISYPVNNFRIFAASFSTKLKIPQAYFCCFLTGRGLKWLFSAQFTSSLWVKVWGRDRCVHQRPVFFSCRYIFCPLPAAGTFFNLREIIKLSVHVSFWSNCQKVSTIPLDLMKNETCNYRWYGVDVS